MSRRDFWKLCRKLGDTHVSTPKCAFCEVILGEDNYSTYDARKNHYGMKFDGQKICMECSDVINCDQCDGTKHLYINNTFSRLVCRNCTEDYDYEPEWYAENEKIHIILRKLWNCSNCGKTYDQSYKQQDLCNDCHQQQQQQQQTINDEREITFGSMVFQLPI